MTNDDLRGAEGVAIGCAVSIFIGVLVVVGAMIVMASGWLR